MELALSVVEGMIDFILLTWLSVIDIRKKEVSFLTMAGAGILWLQAVFKQGGGEVSALITGFMLLAVSILTKQALGLADSIVLFFLSLRYGSVYALSLFLSGMVFLVIFEGIRFIFHRRKDESLPFLPFLVISLLCC